MNRLPYLVLFIVLGFSLWLRVIHLEVFIDWHGDLSRDMLVARHISEFGEFVKTGPFVAGGNPTIARYLVNSPFYYYLLASWWLIGQSVATVHLIYVGFSLLTLLLIFLVGRELKNEELGIFAVLFFGSSYYMVTNDRSLWQPNLLPFYLFCSWYLVLRHARSKNILTGLLMITVAFVGIHIHFSFLSVAPIFIVLLFRQIKSDRRQQVILGLYMAIHCCLLTGLVVRHVPNLEILTQLSTGESPDLVNVLARNVLLTAQDLFSSSWERLISLYLIIALTVFLAKKVLASSANETSTYFQLVSLLLGSLLIPTLYIREWTYYFVPFHSTLLFSIAYITSYLRPKVFKFVVVFCLACLLFQGNQLYVSGQTKNIPDDWEVKPASTVGDFLRLEMVTDWILADIQQAGIKPSEIDIIDSSPSLGRNWGATTSWFFIEQRTGEKTTELIDSANNISVIQQTPVRIYLICNPSLGYPQPLTVVDCQNFFQKYYPYEFSKVRHPPASIDADRTFLIFTSHP